MSGTTVQGAPTRAARATLLGAAGLTIMSAALIAPSLPAMTGEFAGDDVRVRLVLTITSLAIALSAPISGAVADRFGCRPLLAGALASYAVAGTAGYFATGLGMLLVTRALLGVAVGGIMTAISALIADWFDGRRRAAFLGMQQAAASLGGVVFLPLAGMLAAVDWRLPFWLYAAGAVVLPFALRTIPGVRRAAVPPAAGRARNSRRIGGIYLLAVVATLVFYMAPTQLPFLLAGFHLGPAVAGAVVACSTVTGAVGALAFPVLRGRLAPHVLTAGSVALLGLGWVVIGAAGSAGPIVLGLLVGGVGVGLVVPDLNLRLAELAAPAGRGRVLSGLVTGIFLGQFVSPLAAQPLIEVAGISGAFTWTGAALAVAACTATALHRMERTIR